MSEYIEREAVNALIKAECSPKVAAYLIDAVATIPAADVRPVVTGRWIKVSALAPFEQDDFRCSECDSWPWWCGVTEEILPNFCPNCGADMREPPKEE